MKQVITITAAALAVLLVLAGCAGTGSSAGGGGTRGGAAPEWVTNKDLVYPPEQYLAEVGEGDSLKKAKGDAAGGIAQIFNTRITVDSTIQTRYRELTAGDDGDVLEVSNETLINENIGQTADEDLLNLKFGESWTDDLGRVYVVGYLDRAETGMLYRQRIMENESRVIELLDRARAQNEPLRRFAFLEASGIVAEANNVRIQQLDIINAPMSRSLMLGYELGQIRAAAADQAQALKVKIEVAGDVEDRLRGLLVDWTAERGFSVSDGGDMLLNAVISTEKVELNNDYENVSWYLSLNLLDTAGYPAVTMERKGRSSAVSLSSAESRVYIDVAEVINKEFNREFNSYLGSFVEK